MPTKTDVNKNTIELNLDMPTDVISLGNNQLFQIDAKASFELKISGFLKNIKLKSEDDSELFYERAHNAITICGARGTGKSTFIRNILDDLANDKDGENLVLPVIDPTLVSSKENVLVLIISLIKTKIDKSFPNTNISNEKYSIWQKTLTDLAGGLCQIDGIGAQTNYGDEWEDKNYVLESGLQKAKQGLSLEVALNQFIKSSLELMGKEALVITFDDIDTQFERGWPVLETVRKYLTHKQLIIIISGDIDLYRTLIRRAVLESIGDTVLNYDRPNNKFHNHQNTWESDPLIQKIDRLEEQYLLKVLKPENRIHMKSLRKMVEEKGDSLSFQVTAGQGNSESLQSYLNKIFNKILGRNNKNQIYIDAILSLPARTIWQFLKTTQELTKEQSYEELRNALTNVNHRLTDIFSSALLSQNIDTDGLMSSTSFENRVFNAYWHWLSANKLQNKLEPYLPTYEHFNQNQLAITFSSLTALTKHISPKSFIACSLRNSSVNFIFQFIPNMDKELFEYLNTQNSPELYDFSLRASSIISHLSSSMRVLAISVPDNQSFTINSALKRVWGYKPSKDTKGKEKRVILKDFVEKIDFEKSRIEAQKNIYLREYWKVIELQNDKLTGQKGIFNRLSDLPSTFGGLPNLVHLMTVKTNTSQGERKSYICFPLLIASIAEILIVETEDEITEKLKDLVDKEILPKPVFLDDEASLIDDGEEDELDFDTEGKNTWGQFFEALSIWIAETKKRFQTISVSQQTLESALKRYYKNADSMCQENRKLDPYLGNLLHRHLIAFLSALHFEENKHSLNSKKLNSKSNPTSDRVFIENIGKDELEKQSSLDLSEYPLLDVFLSCPLIGVFLYPHSEKKVVHYQGVNWFNTHVAQFYSYTGANQEKLDYKSAITATWKNGDNEVSFHGLWDILNSVPLNTSEKFKNVASIFKEVTVNKEATSKQKQDDENAVANKNESDNQNENNILDDNENNTLGDKK
ncbi:hypothetical protein [Pseudoalteromonas sp. S558]|uniref:hypothetical protein n=1 Tax=Pseudoalteromonas sp. S558 TaxID=2066515 RepID=UPI00110B5582|nr:hypothetical protein [Pseudoalteromonas sp. S558]TMO03064.1 hypothetical protein CWB66_11725 [Pseudoalteromonas sp. S558]